jgi:6-phosphogluconolactonase (cycloisomerase 2 family)
MKLRTRIGATALAFAAASATSAGLAASAFAAPAAGGAGGHAVFVETDNLAGNQVVSYSRGAGGALTLAATYQTGGLGGILTGSVVDHQASQGALGYDPADQLLFATNAGSNTVSVFGVSGAYLALRQVIGSGGEFPVSVAVHGDLVYVLNARNGGSVTGFRIRDGRLGAIRGSTRLLGLDPTATPEFVNTPGQVAFSPDGSLLLVTTKANGNDVDVWHVDVHGSLSAEPVINPEPGTVPFALTFTSPNRLQLVQAGANADVTFNLDSWGDLTQVSSAPTSQAASCWIVRDGRFSYVSNAGSATLTGFSNDGTGHLTDLGNTSTDGGTVDAAVTPSGADLYVRGGLNGTLDGFSVAADGSLTAIGSLTVANAAGGEGIVAS